MMAFPLNTGELICLVPIMLLNILPFRKFGSAAIFAKCIKTGGEKIGIWGFWQNRFRWKNRRTRVRELLKRGVTRNYALTTGCARKGPWRMSTTDELRLYCRRKSPWLSGLISPCLMNTSNHMVSCSPGSNLA